MIDEQLLRTILREEIERYIPHLARVKTKLTVPEAMRRFGRRYDFILGLIQAGEVEATYIPKGRNGRPQYLIVTESAERHPQLGGAVGLPRKAGAK